MKDERDAVENEPFNFKWHALHPSSFILPPST